MRPAAFPEANCTFGPPQGPDGLDDSQCGTIPAFKGLISGGNLDGSEIAIVAWKPNEEELKQLNAGGMVFLTTIGWLPPHFLCTQFHIAKSV